MAEKTSILYTAEDLTKGATDSVRAQILGLQRDLAGVNAQARSFGETFRTVLAGSAGAALFRDIIERTIDAERTFNQFNATLQATGHAAGLTSAQIRELVGGLSNTTAFDDDSIQKAANALLRFRDIQGDTFKQALAFAPDVATALGTDLVSAAQLLGRAFEDPLTGLKGLRAAGIQSQKDLIENLQLAGDKAGAQQVLIQALQKSLGGAAAGENQGLFGSARATAKAYDELLKSIGRSNAIQGLVQGALGGLTEIIKDIGDASGEGAKHFRGFIAEIVEGASKIGGVTGLFLQAQAALIAPSAPAAHSLAVTGKIGGGAADQEESAARVGRLQSQLDQQQEAAVARQKQRDKDLRGLAKVRTDAELQAAQTQAEQLQQGLDIQHARGLVSEKDYYDARTAITEDSAKVRIAAVSKEIANEQALLARKGSLAVPAADRGAIQANVERLQAQRQQIQAKASGDAAKNSLEEENAQQRLADAIGEVNAKLFEQEGELAQAAKIRFEIENRTLRNQLASENKPGAQDRLNQLEQQIIASKQLAEQDEKAALIRQDLATEEERIQNSRRVGAISELNALKQTGDARQAQLAALRRIADAEDAVENKSPAQIAHVRQLKAEIESLAASADLLGDKFRTVFEDGLSGPLTDFITGTRKAGDAFKDFVRNIERSLANIASQNVAEQIFGKGGAAGGVPNFFAGLFGGAGGGAAGAGIGDFLKRLIGPSTANPYANLSSSAGTLFAAGGVSYLGRSMDLPRFAYGGVSRRASIFGEGNMAEAAVPLPDGRRIPVDLKGGAAGGTTVIMNITTPDATSFRRSSLQITNQLNAQLARGRQRS